MDPRPLRGLARLSFGTGDLLGHLAPSIAKHLGSVAIAVPLFIYMYYVLIECWCLVYVLDYLTGAYAAPHEGNFKSHFDWSVGNLGDGSLFNGEHTLFFGVVLFTYSLNFWLIYRGVSKGIERLCKLVMPLMALLAFIVLVRVLTLGAPIANAPDRSVINGLGFMWNPNPEKLWEPSTWLAASSQIFFSLSVGFGIVINYSSYLRNRDDVVLSGLTSTSINEFFEVCFGGLITLTAAFIFIGPAAGEEGTFGLGFVALPHVFSEMPAGRWVGLLWFLMLFFAAITSSVSMLQPVLAFLEEAFEMKRKISVIALALITGFGTGLLLWFSKDSRALNTVDFWVGSVLIFTLAMIQAVLYGWVLGIDRGEIEAHRGALMKIPRPVQWMIKYVIPVYMLTIFVLFCWADLPTQLKELAQHQTAQFAMGLIFLGIVAINVLIAVARRRWNQKVSSE